MKLLILAALLLLSTSITVEAKSSNAKKSDKNAGTMADKPDEYEQIFDRTVKGKSLDEYYAAINGGWHRNIGAIRASLKPEASYLVIHSQEPADVFDLRSANNFKRGLLSKGIKQMAESTIGIGHVFLSWRCQVNGQPVEGTIGMTGELSDQVKGMLEGGWGLAAFNAYFSDGHLQTPELLDFEYDEALPMHTLAVQVNENVCANAMAFVKSFLYHKNKPYTRFGLGLDSEKYEGGGCGSFGVTVLNKSGIFGENRITPHFWRTIQGRSSLFGRGLELPESAHVGKNNPRGSTKKINKAVLFLLAKWDPSSSKPGTPIHLMDPEMLLLFLKTTYRAFGDDLTRANGSFAQSFFKSPQYRARMSLLGEVKYDSKDRAKWKVVRGEKQPIDSRFDPQAAKVVAATNAWTKGLKAQGFRAQPIVIMGKDKKTNLGLVIDQR